MFKRLFVKISKTHKHSSSAPSSPSSQTNEYIQEWSVQSVEQWLDMHQLGQYKSSFQKNCINGEVLCDLTLEDLEKLGVTIIGHQKKLMKLIKRISKFPQSPSIHSTSSQPILSPSTSTSCSTSNLNDSDDDLSTSDDPVGDSLLKPATIPSFSHVPNEIKDVGQILEDFIDAIVIVDTHKIINYFNKSAEKMFGYSREDIIGCNVKVLIPEPHRSKHDQYWDKYANSVTRESKIVGKGRMVRGRANDGLEFPVYIAIQAQNVANNSKVYIAAIKDLRSVQPQSSKKINDISSVLNNMVNACIVIGKESNIQFFNHSAEVMFGYTQDEIMGKNVSLLMPTRVGSIHDMYVRRYLKTGNASIIGKGRKEIGKRKDGTEVQIWLTVAVTRWGDNNDLSFMATIHEFKDLMNASSGDAISSPTNKNTTFSPSLKQDTLKTTSKHDGHPFELSIILDHIEMRRGLEKFMKSSQNYEILEFLDEVDRFMSHKSNKFRLAIALKIKQKFFKHNADKELNIPHHLRSQVLEKILQSQNVIAQEVQCSARMFDDVVTNVMWELCRDIIPRYLSSVDGSELLKKYRHELQG